ncbi:MAG: TolC family protein [Sulfurospirillum sp.]
MKRFFLINLSIFLFFCVNTFADTTLNGLIHYALKNSTIIKQGKATIELSRAQRKENRSAQFGAIDLAWSYTHFNLPRTLVPLTPSGILQNPGAAPTTTNLFTTGLVYNVPLFTGFAQTRQIEMDDIATKLSKNKLSLTKEQLAYNIASLYLSTLSLQDMANAQKKNIEALKRLKNTIKEEVKLGKKARIDLLKAENNLQGSISYFEVLKGNIAITKASLAALAGLNRIGEIKPFKIIIKKPNYSIDKLFRNSLALDKVRIAEFNIKKADKRVQMSRASQYPQLSLSSYYGYNYGKNDGSNANPGDFNSEKNWQVGLNAKWTLFDFGKSDAATQKAKIAKITAILQKQQTLLDLRKSLVEAYEKMRQEYAKYTGNTMQYALAKESEKIERVRYQNGVSTINDLLYAISKTSMAKAKLIESQYSYQRWKFYMDYILERGVK